MELRIFQIVIPVIFVAYVIKQVIAIRKSKRNAVDVLVPILILLGLTLVALFPDATTKRLSRLMGVEDNVNGLLIFLVGILLLLVNNLYEKMRAQQDLINKLAIHIGVNEYEEKERQ